MTESQIECRNCQRRIPLLSQKAKEVICPFCRRSMVVDTQESSAPSPPLPPPAPGETASPSFATAPPVSVEPPVVLQKPPIADPPQVDQRDSKEESEAPPTRFEPSEAPRRASSQKSEEIDDLLPPPATSIDKTAASDESAEHAEIDSLLPPKAEDDPAAAELVEESAPSKTPIVVQPSEGSISIPTTEGEVITVREPTKTIKRGDREIELHMLTSEEKERRRMIRSVMVWLFCAVVLGVSLAVLLSL